MSFWKIVLNSLKYHRFSNSLAASSIAMGIALLVAVHSFREQYHNALSQAGISVDTTPDMAWNEKKKQLPA